MKDCFIYLSGPITATPTHTVAQNVDAAVAAYFDCIRRGLPAFCPHLGALDPRAFDIPYETWMAYDFAIIDRCSHVLMLDRWETSKGAERERQYATLRAKTVFYSLDRLEAHVCGKL